MTHRPFAAPGAAALPRLPRVPRTPAPALALALALAWTRALNRALALPRCVAVSPATSLALGLVPGLVPGLALGLVLAAGLTPPALAATDGVTDTSYRTESGERVIELSAVVDAPLDKVWAAFTTSEGFAAWAAPFARIDLRVGGSFETSYLATAQPGGPDNIRNEILALVPQRLVVIRNVQAPAKAPFDAAAFQKTHTAVHFQALDARSTRVTLQNAGYGDGPAFDGAYRHFLAGNAWTLGKLRSLFQR